jgi:CubicO group peptidase (beta-lactamase class C family)
MAAKTISNTRLKAKTLDPALSRFVRAQLERTGTPGVAVGVLHKGRAQAGGFGVTSLNGPAPVDAETLFQIGSTTKTFTATAVMRLVEQGKLDLDVPIRRYLKDLQLRDAQTARRVTLRHLLTHTGGWVGDYFADTGRGDDALTRMVRDLRKVPQLTPLGSIWHYNNAGFYLAGRVIEQVTRKPYETVVRELLLDPLGMTRSFFFADEAIVYRVAAGHVSVNWGKRHVVARPWGLARAVGPAGSLISDAIDQLRWAQFSMGDGRGPNGKRLLKRASMREMQRAQAPAGSLADAVGLSWLLSDIDGVRFVAHGGTTNGQLSAFMMAPDEGFAITVLTNSTRGGEVHRDIVNWAMRHYLGVKKAEPKAMSLNGTQLDLYEGRYVDGFKTVGVDLKARGKGFIVTYEILKKDEEEDEGPGLPPFTVSLVDEERALITSGRLRGTRAEFLRDERGRIKWMRLGGRLYRKSAAKR